VLYRGDEYLACKAARKRGVMSVKVLSAGIYVVDFITSEMDRIPGPGEIAFPRIRIHIGGHAANVAIDLGKLGLSPGSVSTAGAVGTDVLGDFVQHTFHSHRITSHLYKTDEAGTSKSFIPLEKGGKRRILCDIGANAFLSPGFIKQIIETEKPLIFYCGAVGMLGPVYDELVSILEYAKSLGCITAIDPIIPPGKTWDHVKAACPFIDIFHCNNDEARLMTGSADENKVVRELLSRGIRLPVVSMGDRGLLFGYGESIYKLPPFKVPLADATGAGDAFCAGLMKKIIDLKGDSLQKVFSFQVDELREIFCYGAAAGAASVTAPGTTTNVTEQRVLSIIREQGTSLRLEPQSGK
jgi:sugar/nucleoside kinase (ribokinase family)